MDSASCAACTYMLAVTCDAKERYKDAIDIMEYKYTRLEDIARIKKMGVQNLPSLYINGKLAYASQSRGIVRQNRRADKQLRGGHVVNCDASFIESVIHPGTLKASRPC